MFHQDGKILIKFILLTIFILAIIGYSLFQAKNLIGGPQITLDWPKDGATVASADIAVKGEAHNIAYITLNNRQIYVDKDGNFNEDLLLAPGYNVWTLEAKDKFGRVVSKKIELVFNKSL